MSITSVPVSEVRQKLKRKLSQRARVRGDETQSPLQACQSVCVQFSEQQAANTLAPWGKKMDFLSGWGLLNFRQRYLALTQRVLPPLAGAWLIPTMHP